MANLAKIAEIVVSNKKCAEQITKTLENGPFLVAHDIEDESILYVMTCEKME